MGDLCSFKFTLMFCSDFFINCVVSKTIITKASRLLVVLVGDSLLSTDCVTIMYKNSQTTNNVFHLTLFNQEVKLPVSVHMQDHHQVFTSYLITNSVYHISGGLQTYKAD
jgi:hypothetical protein